MAWLRACDSILMRKWIKSFDGSYDGVTGSACILCKGFNRHEFRMHMVVVIMMLVLYVYIPHIYMSTIRG